MFTWHRTIPFEKNSQRNEEWTLFQEKVFKKKYNVCVSLGKLLDIVALQKNVVANFEENLIITRKTRNKLYSSKLIEVKNCLICKSRNRTEADFTIYNAQYVQCIKCHHYYLKSTPDPYQLEEIYTRDKGYQKEYIDPKTTNFRVNKVALPKAEWAVESFKKIYGYRPKSILDVGAGSGHFVQACKKLGLKADGIDISDIGRKFCRDNFGFDLINKDFIQSWNELEDYDIVSFWGVIEHISNPMKMLQTSTMIRRGKKRMILASVPRWDCLGTTIQQIYNENIIRHLDPLGHINCFTDSSIATAFHINKIEIKAAWYFGMDIYELFVQLGYQSKNMNFVNQMRKKIPIIQNTIDGALLSDEIALVGTVG